MITLHFTQPHHEVVIDSTDDILLDLNTIGDKPLNYELKMKSSQRVKLSVSFDAARVDEMNAIKFLQKLQTYLNDPDSMLL